MDQSVTLKLLESLVSESAFFCGERHPKLMLQRARIVLPTQDIRSVLVIGLAGEATEQRHLQLVQGAS